MSSLNCNWYDQNFSLLYDVISISVHTTSTHHCTLLSNLLTEVAIKNIDGEGDGAHGCSVSSPKVLGDSSTWCLFLGDGSGF